MSDNSSSELVFGFLPPAVLQNINEVGNWKTRSNAIEQVQRGLQHLGPAQTNILQQQLPEFAAFTLQLLSDHNFKVVTAGLSVLADAARTLGQALQQHMSELLPVLLTRLMDHRTPVAAAAFQAAASIMQHTHSSNPAAFANKLLLLQQHEAMGKGQDCSGLLELLILAILKGPVSSLDLPAAMRLMLKSMQRSSSDGDSSSSKQHALSMEAFALATDSLGAQLPNLMKQAGGTDLQVTQVLMQVQRLQRPQLGPGGMSIQHSSSAQAAIAAAEAAAPGGSSFKIGAGLYDRTINSSHASSFNSESSFGLGSLNLGANNNSSKGMTLGNAATEALMIDSVNGPLGGAWSQDQQHQQMLPPGSLGALAAHAQLISSASSSAAAAAAAASNADSGAGGSRPVSGLTSGRLNNTGQDGRYGNKLQLSLSSGSVGAEQQPYMAGRSPLGSPRALPAASGSRSHLQPQSSPRWREDSGIAMLQASSSSIGSAVAGAGQQAASRTHSQQQDQMQDQLSKLHSYDSSRYAGSRQDGQPQHSTPVPAGDPITAGRRQQAEADSTGIDWSRSGGQQAGLQAMPTLNLRYQQPVSSTNSGSSGLLGRRSTAEQARGLSVDAAATHHSAIEMPAQGGTGSGGSSSWLTAAGPGWAPSDPAGLEPTANPYSPGRAETLSPSRGERLAQLKRRQVEKRAVSATGSTRGSTPWDSQDGAPAGALTAPPLTGSTEGLGPRAVTAGPLPAGALGWRASNSGADSPCSTGIFGYGASSSPAPAEEAGSYAAGSGSNVRGGHGSLLQWHIPTGPGGRVLPPGSAGSGVAQYHPQQHQQQQSSSPEPNGGHSHSQGSYSPTNSWDSSSGLAAGRAFQSSTGSAPATGSPKMGPLLQNVPRTVSAAAVLMNAAVDSHTASSSSNADSSGLGYRSSRFQQVRSGSSSPAPTETGASGQSSGLPAGSSRLHGTISSAAGAGAGFNRQQQQGSIATRAQTAAPAVGISAGSTAGYSTAQQGPLEWGAGSSSSPTGRLGGGACAPNSSSSSGAAGPGPGSMNGAGSPTRSPGGLGGRVGSGLRGVPSGAERPQSSGMAEAELAGADLAPLQDPEAGLRQTITKLQQANVATRKEIDWQAQLDALTDARRLLAHHLDVMRPSARELVLSALPAVDELRSTTARMALLFFQELPCSGLSMERELDEVVPVLLKKAGDLSTAGRDNFLAQEAAKALSAICAAVSESRALSALITAGANHKSPHVRSKTAALLDEVVAGGAGLEPLLRNGNWAVLDKVFKTAAGMLQDGSLDTRTYAKRLLWGVKAALRGNRPDMDRLMAGITPEGVQRRVVEVLELPAPPPPPANRNGTGAGARLASRSGQPSGCSTPTSGLQPAPPFSAPPASMLTAAGTTAGGYGYDGPASAQRPGYSSVGSTSGGSGSAARRALFSGGSGNSSSGMAPGLQVHGAAAAASMSPGSPNSPTVSGSSATQQRRTTANAVAGSPCSSGNAGGAGALGGVGSRSGGDRRVSGGGCPAGPPGPMSAELQEAVDQVGLQLCSKDWRSRMDALRALSALGPALPEVPNAALEGLLQALTGRLNDGNAKVNQKALEVLCEVVYAISLRVVLIMPSLMPALTANLGSTNDKLRSCASTALDIIASAATPQPQLLIQGLAQAVANGSVRTKIAVIEKLGVVLPSLHQSQPQLTRLLLPAAFSLAQEARGDAKSAAAQLMGLLGSLLGSTAVLSAAANVSSATEQRARELMFGGAARS